MLEKRKSKGVLAGRHFETGSIGCGFSNLKAETTTHEQRAFLQYVDNLAVPKVVYPF